MGEIIKKNEVEEFVAKEFGSSLSIFDLMTEVDPVKRLFIGFVLDVDFIYETMVNYLDELSKKEVAALRSLSFIDMFEFSFWSKEVSLGHRCILVLINWIKNEEIKTTSIDLFCSKGRILFSENKSNILEYLEQVQSEYTSERLVSRNPKWIYWIEQIRKTEFH